MLPLLASEPKPRILEIGLGPCKGVAGASVKLWGQLFPSADVWVADFDAACVKRMQDQSGRIFGARVLTGDQSNRTTLRAWAAKAGGNFNAVLDDVSAFAAQMFLFALASLTPFPSLWLASLSPCFLASSFLVPPPTFSLARSRPCPSHNTAPLFVTHRVAIATA